MIPIPALIAARGGSKGILGKNLQVIHGQSLIGRCVTEAVKSTLCPVFVYSDSDEILQEAKLAGATPIERPKDVSEDDTTSEQTVSRFLNDHDPGQKYPALALLQCTTPFLKAHHMSKAEEVFRKGDWDSVVTATAMVKYLGYEKFNRHTQFIPMYPYRHLRQQMNWGQWLESGGIYLAARHVWTQGRRIGVKCAVIEMSWWESLEIDEPIDLEVTRRIADLFLEGDNHGEEAREEQQVSQG